MEQKVFEKVRTALMEGVDVPYDAKEDKSIIDSVDKRKPVLTLRKLNALKKMRNAVREEVAQNVVFVPYLYGPPENQGEDQNMGGGLNLGM